MATYTSDRRKLLKVLGSIGATCAYPFASDELYGQIDPNVAHQHGSVPPPDGSVHFLNAADFAIVSRIADLIIPQTDSPGAIAAGVPAYIDYVIGRNTDQQLVVADGLRWLDREAERTAKRKFVELTEAEQMVLLEPLCAAADAGDLQLKGRNVQCFALLKNLTADGYYTSHAGLLEELKYQGNKARPGYLSC